METSRRDRGRGSKQRTPLPQEMVFPRWALELTLAAGGIGCILGSMSTLSDGMLVPGAWIFATGCWLIFVAGVF